MRREDEVGNAKGNWELRIERKKKEIETTAARRGRPVSNFTGGRGGSRPRALLVAISYISATAEFNFSSCWGAGCNKKVILPASQSNVDLCLMCECGCAFLLIGRIDPRERDETPTRGPPALEGYKAAGYSRRKTKEREWRCGTLAPPREKKKEKLKTLAPKAESRERILREERRPLGPGGRKRRACDPVWTLP